MPCSFPWEPVKILPGGEWGQGNGPSQKRGRISLEAPSSRAMVKAYLVSQPAWLLLLGTSARGCSGSCLDWPEEALRRAWASSAHPPGCKAGGGEVSELKPCWRRALRAPCPGWLRLSRRLSGGGREAAKRWGKNVASRGGHC